MRDGEDVGPWAEQHNREFLRKTVREFPKPDTSLSANSKAGCFKIGL